MRVYVGFDDTDTIDADLGTGKLARWFEDRLPDGCRLWGVVRQQLLVDERVPYTSHNSSACVVLELDDPHGLNGIIDRAAAHIGSHFLEGSDPGLCVAAAGAPGFAELADFGRHCTCQVVSQKAALGAAAGVHLSAHGGTGDGIIGAAAAVGLTAAGWCGRFIEFGQLREYPDMVQVKDLEERQIQVVSVDRDAAVPGPADMVLTNGWVRPRLMGGRAILLVRAGCRGAWENIGAKRNHRVQKAAVRV
jgi:hypothetical protein